MKGKIGTVKDNLYLVLKWRKEDEEEEEENGDDNDGTSKKNPSRAIVYD